MKYRLFVKILKHLFSKVLKSDSHLPKKKCVICFIENPLKMMKNPFYFILKSSFRSQDT